MREDCTCTLSFAAKERGSSDWLKRKWLFPASALSSAFSTFGSADPSLQSLGSFDPFLTNTGREDRWAMVDVLLSPLRIHPSLPLNFIALHTFSHSYSGKEFCFRKKKCFFLLCITGKGIIALARKRAFPYFLLSCMPGKSFTLAKKNAFPYFPLPCITGKRNALAKKSAFPCHIFHH